jgi:hypothetical protein
MPETLIVALCVSVSLVVKLPLLVIAQFVGVALQSAYDIPATQNSKAADARTRVRIQKSPEAVR